MKNYWILTLEHHEDDDNPESIIYKDRHFITDDLMRLNSELVGKVASEALANIKQAMNI